MLLKLVLLCIALALPVTAEARQLSEADLAAPRIDYVYRIDLWRNLHHLLYAQTLSDPIAGKVRKVRLIAEDEQVFETLTPEERGIWQAAREHYARAIIGQNLLFDDPLYATGTALSDAGLTAAAIPPALREALGRVEPIYRKYWWPRHRAASEAWKKRLQPLLGQHGPAMARRLETAYGVPWPTQPVTVDLVYYANPEGAYTRSAPDRIAIATSATANQGIAALEILLHETSHVMIDDVRSRIQAITAAEGAKPGVDPKAVRDLLWHEVLFYIAGRIVADRFPGYVPYADKNQLWIHAWPGPDRALIERHIDPYLAGASTLDAALTALIRDLATTG